MICNIQTQCNRYRRYNTFDICYPKEDLLQALTKKSDIQLLDTFNKGNVREVQQARAYEFAGSQYIDTGVKVQGGQPIDITINYLPTNLTDKYNGIFGCGGYSGSMQGIYLNVSPSTFELVGSITDGNGNGFDINTGVIFTENTLYNIRLQWSGVVNETLIITVNDINYTFTPTLNWSGDSHTSLLIGTYAISTSTVIVGRIFNYSYIINGGNEVVYNCEERAGNTSYSTTQGVTADIYGSLTGFHVIDHRKTTCYLDSVGFAIDNSNPDVAIPIGTDGTPVASYDTWYKGVVPKNVNFINASCFVNNNSDNVCDVNADFPIVPSNDGWFFGCIFIPRGTSLQVLGYDSRALRLSGGVLYFRENSGTLISTNITIDENRYYTLFVRFGLDGTQKYLEVWLDNTFRGRTNFTNDTYRFKNALCGNWNGATSVKEIACTYLYNGQDITDEEALNWRGNPIKGGSDELLIPFIETGTSNRVYNVNGAVGSNYYDIEGAITNGVSWITQDVYHFKEKYGYTAPNIPASLLNIGKDVLGNDLTNPPCKIGSNDGSQKQYPLAADLIHADDDEIYFDKTTPELVVARELNNADLPLDNDYTRWNAVDNCKMQGLMYANDLTTEENEKITKCYAKEQTGTVAQFNDGDVIQFNDGNIIEFNN